MKIRIYHELNGTVRIVKVVEQGPEKGKESSMFHNLKPGSMVEVAEKIIAKCKESGLLENTYVAHCPHCGSAIKMDKNKEKLLTIKECYVCERKITLEKEDIIPVYALS